MRVLIVADVVGGVAAFVEDLAAELAAAGDEVHLALIGPADRAAACLALPVAGVEVRDLRLEWMPDPWADVEATANWVEGLRSVLAPDVIHLNTFAVATSAPAVLTVHSDVCTWWRAVHRRDAPPEWDRYRELVRAALRAAEVVITPTAALRNALTGVHGPLPAARVIPNGTSVPEASGEPRARRVVTAGRLWDEAKNAGALTAAASDIDGEVELIEGRPHAAVLARLGRAAVFAEPARYEPFGLAALEAARCGCALVLGDIPSLREVWGDAAAYVPPDDAAALRVTVNALLADEARRGRAAAAARDRARRYTAAAMAGAYRAAYASAAACHGVAA